MSAHTSSVRVERRQTPRRARRYWPLTVHLATIYTILVAVACTVVGWIGYRHTAQVAFDAAHERFVRVGRETRATVERLYLPIESLVATLAEHPLARAGALAERLPSLALLAAALRQNPAVSAVYVGYADGSFFLVRPLGDARVRASVGAPTQAAFAVQSVERAGAAVRGRYLFFDAALAPLADEVRAGYTFDPRTRPWYAAARARSPALVRTDPYVFFTTAEIGKTFAVAAGPGAVIGADLTLGELSRSLATQAMSPRTVSAVFDERGALVAWPDAAQLVRREGAEALRPARLDELGAPVLGEVMAAVRAGALERRLTLRAGDESWVALAYELPAKGDQRNFLAIATPEDELLAAARRGLAHTAALTAVAMLVAMLLTVGASRLVSRPLVRLAEEARAIRRFRLEGDAAPVDSPVREVHLLALGMATLKRTLRKFLDISAALAGEQRLDRLLGRVADEAASASGASAALVYALADEGRALHLGAAHLAGGATFEHAPALALDSDDPLVAIAQGARSQTLALRPGHWPASLAALQAIIGSDAATLLAVPLRNRRGQLVGLLTLVRPAALEWTAELVSFVEAVSGSAAVAIENQRLLAAQKELLDAFIRLVAGAIDAKSPYTGGHCQRVPELTFMLARAACAARSGPLAGFALDDDAWEALRIAAWLHDCGKVTTPEYVVDKATKLETLYDRIHEVRMRFEVLKRDAEVDCWRAVAAGADAAAATARLRAQWAELDEEFAFVAQCNVGGEAMAPEALERLQRIAQRTWLRTLDDRLGLAHEELARRAARPAAALPAREALLADKPEHRIERPAQELVPSDNPWGFRMAVPALKFDHGELHNLAQPRGTLTEEERYLINHHIVQTIVMLSQLPFPAQLKAVPEIAGGHHEKMDGSGYPKGLTREQMSWPARMMAIADIFEALTAADRPYKRGKTLSESLAIMARMRDRAHIDPDLFDLFLEAGVWREYAQRFMDPAQIDAVETARYRRSA